MRHEDEASIHRTPLFARLPKSLAAELMRGLVVHELPKGAMLFRQGGRANFLHVILSGRVGLLAETPDRHETVVEFFPGGEVMIAPAVILEAPYLMSAMVIEDARIALIPAAAFRALLEREHALALAMTRMLARHWRMLVRQIKELKLKSTAQRLGSYLLAMAGQEGESFSLRLNEERQLIAARLGMTPESLSRAFQRLKTVGVGGRGRIVHIADVRRLREFCQEDDLV